MEGLSNILGAHTGAVKRKGLVDAVAISVTSDIPDNTHSSHRNRRFDFLSGIVEGRRVSRAFERR
ncbi:hypothetical protein CH251_25270 [Rhodococcus sp. 06-462-5]|nr:hypothetical protein CH251_25270 [Rhodococcus sp. 06-462-5]OZE65263.1 hypothetical protein CH270_14790 [Rhodococcus sp. 02-925g]